MATNQQLKDYINQQTKLGVLKDTIKSSLLEAGWNEGDVTQAMAEAESGVQVAAPLTPAQPFFKLAEPVAKSSPVPFVTSDIFQAKNEPIFQSAEIGKPGISNSSETKPQIILSSMKGKPTGGGGKLLPIILAVLSVALLGGNIYFFMQNGGLNSKIDSLNNEKASSESQIASLAADKKNLTDQIGSLNKTISDFDNQLSLYGWPPNVSETQELPITIKGVLGGGGRALYFLITNKNIMVIVKNSKDSKVDEILKPLLGTQVEISGTHLVKSDSVTVTTVNGSLLLSLQSVSTSTPKMATSTSGSVSTSTSGTGTGKAASSTP